MNRINCGDLRFLKKLTVIFSTSIMENALLFPLKLCSLCWCGFMFISQTKTTLDRDLRPEYFCDMKGDSLQDSQLIYMLGLIDYARIY